MRRYQIIGVDKLSDTTILIRSQRPDKKIISGQCFNVGIPGFSINREYSMYSSADAPFLEFLIKVVPDGCLTPHLNEQNVGDELEIDGPYGSFVLHTPEDKNLKYLFLATGTGIAPFRSFALTYPDLNYKIIHGIRHRHEMYNSSDYEAGKYVPCISNNENYGISQRVTKYLSDNPVDPSTIVYLCGNKNMIVDCFEILRDQGVPGDNIFTEVFF
jgi:ferredoxin-NADP reductase